MLIKIWSYRYLGDQKRLISYGKGLDVEVAVEKIVKIVIFSSENEGKKYKRISLFQPYEG